TVEVRKRNYGPWMLQAFRALAKLKGLRGTALDLFGYSAERRMERRLVTEYEALISEVLTRLAPHNHALALDLARVPEHIRGFGHVKERHVKQAKEHEARVLAAFREARPTATV